MNKDLYRADDVERLHVELSHKALLHLFEALLHLLEAVNDLRNEHCTLREWSEVVQQ